VLPSTASHHTLVCCFEKLFLTIKHIHGIQGILVSKSHLVYIKMNTFDRTEVDINKYYQMKGKMHESQKLNENYYCKE
jgi:hypothetical protein